MDDYDGVRFCCCVYGRNRLRIVAIDADADNELAVVHADTDTVHAGYGRSAHEQPLLKSTVRRYDIGPRTRGEFDDDLSGVADQGRDGCAMSIEIAGEQHDK